MHLAFLAVLFVPAPAWGASENDAKARKQADEAIDAHYLAMNMDKAEAGLKAAIELCKKDQCSPSVKATLHRDLAVVYIAGMKQAGLGKQHMEQAVELDPKLELNPDLITDEVREAFVFAGGVDAGNGDPLDSATEITLEEDDDAAAAEPDAGEADNSSQSVHFVSGAVQFDFMRHAQTPEACTALDSEYFCYNNRDLRYGSGPGEGALSPVAGNEVQGGFVRATTRVLVGYDYRVIDNVLAGVRAGFAFGAAPVAPGEQAFQAWHLEVRGQYLFLDNPLSGSGFDPYIGLEAGAAQVDSGVPIDVWLQDAPPPAGTRYELHGYRKTGKGFFGAQLGTYYSLTKKVAPFIELQYMQMLGVSARVVALRAGLAYGL